MAALVLIALEGTIFEITQVALLKQVFLGWSCFSIINVTLTELPDKIRFRETLKSEMISDSKTELRFRLLSAIIIKIKVLERIDYSSRHATLAPKLVARESRDVPMAAKETSV